MYQISDCDNRERKPRVTPGIRTITDTITSDGTRNLTVEGPEADTQDNKRIISTVEQIRPRPYIYSRDTTTISELDKGSTT